MDTSSTSPDYAARYATLEHIELVMRTLAHVQHEITRRMFTHDRSKLLPPEAEMFDRYTARLFDLTYGTPEYEECRQQMMQEALPKHYRDNRHHPEHFPGGVDDMNLIDVIEMLCDWYAATMRHNDGDIYKSLAFNTERFSLSPQLVSILRNTIPILQEGNTYGGETQRDLHPPS